MRAGRLRHRFTVQQDAGTTQDSKGAPVVSWATYCVRQGSLEALSGREGEALRQRYAEADYQVQLRSDSQSAAITPRMRLVLSSRTFDILANTDPDGRGRERVLIVVERNL